MSIYTYIAKTILQVYYRDAVAAFVAFDVTRAATFDAIEQWKNDLDSKLFQSNGQPIPAVLLANKVIETLLVLTDTLYQSQSLMCDIFV